MTIAQTLNIYIAQMDAIVGDIEGNVKNILAHWQRAVKLKADLAVFPELTITGYPPEDLVLRRSFQDESMQAVETLREATAAHNTALLIGGLMREGKSLYNAAFLLEGGKLIHRQHKHSLPNYGVFDEKRLFTEGLLPKPALWRGMKLGILVCEDLWEKAAPSSLMDAGAEMLIAINASPYQAGKAKERREKMVAAGAGKAPVIYVNMVGGQDELVFDGRSFGITPGGEDAFRLSAFREEGALTTWEKKSGTWQCVKGPMATMQDNFETIYQVMMLGLKDYVEKNRFPGVVIGFSGGVDSGLTAAIAVDALGKDRVRCIMMPSHFTSDESIEDAAQCAKLLGVRLDTIAIGPGMNVFDEMLADIFAGAAPDTTEENIQARIRGNLLMAISNKFGFMVLNTGNKSEMSVGYATLYGDMCGGYSVLKDVYKTTIFTLANWRNGHSIDWAKGPKGRVIPERMITKPPSAELRANQKDEDSLPPYDVLDKILEGFIERRLSAGDPYFKAFDRDTVIRVLGMLTRAEYKRRQAAPGVKVTGMSFGRDWRYPITNRFKN